MGTLSLNAASSGSTTLTPTNNITATVTLPGATTTLVGNSVVQTFSASQRGTVATDNDLSFDMNDKQLQMHPHSNRRTHIHQHHSRAERVCPLGQLRWLRHHSSGNYKGGSNLPVND